MPGAEGSKFAPPGTMNFSAIQDPYRCFKLHSSGSNSFLVRRWASCSSRHPGNVVSQCHLAACAANWRRVLCNRCQQLLANAACWQPLLAPSQVPQGAAGYYLLGRIARLQSRPGEAAEYFSEALALNPLLWQAYEELCQLGEHPWPLLIPAHWAQGYGPD